jgi:hypothetical protein
MACKKTELVTAINTYVSARLTNDNNLINYAGNVLQQRIDSVEFEPEEATEESAE